MEREEEERAAGLEWAADASLEVLLALIDAAEQADRYDDLPVLARYLARRLQSPAHPPPTAERMGEVLHRACRASSAGNRDLNRVRVLEDALGKVRERARDQRHHQDDLTTLWSELEQRLVDRVVREVGARCRETLRLIDDDLLPCVAPGDHRAHVICLSWCLSLPTDVTSVASY
jgi:hypothetical protein